MSQPGVTGVLCADNQGLALAGRQQVFVFLSHSLSVFSWLRRGGFVVLRVFVELWDPIRMQNSDATYYCRMQQFDWVVYM